MGAKDAPGTEVEAGGGAVDLGGERDLEARGRGAATGAGLEEEATALVDCLCCRAGGGGAFVRTEGLSNG